MGIYKINGDRADFTEPKTYNFLAYNVGNFADYGAHEGYSGDDLEGWITDWIQFFGENTPDVCCLTESRTFVDSAKTASSKNRIYSPLYKYVSNYNPFDSFGVALLTNNEQDNVHSGLFTTRVSSESKYLYTTLELNGVNLFVAVAHLNHTVTGQETASNEARLAQIAELIALSSNHDNVIIGADFNFRSISQFSPFTEAGFTLANGGIFGDFTTMDNDSGYTSDGVVIKGNKIKLKDFRVFKGVTSGDHLATMTKILIG